MHRSIRSVASVGCPGKACFSGRTAYSTPITKSFIPSRPSVQANAAQYDPEGLFKGIPAGAGIIQRRMMQKQMTAENKEFNRAMSSAMDETRKEVLIRRETRTAPTNSEELVEYFLNTVGEDLEYEVAKYRPKLDKEFFRYLDTTIGQVRFSPKPDEDRLAELDTLRKYLDEAAQAVDIVVEKTSTAVERMKKLLTAKDKKQMIVDMAADNEIDQALMDLLQQNIDMAKAAGQDEPAKFMEKVKLAASRYLVKAA